VRCLPITLQNQSMALWNESKGGQKTKVKVGKEKKGKKGCQWTGVLK
jgi:hypothetical protein